MTEYRNKLEKMGIRIPEVLLPAAEFDMSRWAVIACDQYTSQLDYWKKVEELTNGVPSTLNLIFPECYLEEAEPEKRIENINRTMRRYISESVLSDPVSGFILVKREIPDAKPRWGLVAALDLEQYDFSVDSNSLIRATEGTILDRIPPRVKIRKNAVLELPHIMVLIDDPEKTLIEPLTAKLSEFQKVYDFDLMMDSGHLTGYRVNSEKHIALISKAVETLSSQETLQDKYKSDKAFVFAMGDGNHSLATAKTIWENYKKKNSGNPEYMSHPSRWALVELVNIFSDGIQFEAIHRVLFNASPDTFLSGLKNNPDFRISELDNLPGILEIINNPGKRQICGYRTSKGYGIIEALNPESSIIAGTIQNHIDNYLKQITDASVDYIHGIDVTDELGEKDGNIGVFLPSIEKDTFFQTVIDDGAFPRKTFSMGEAFEKRFYVESRKIR